LSLLEAEEEFVWVPTCTERAGLYEESGDVMGRRY